MLYSPLLGSKVLVLTPSQTTSLIASMIANTCLLGFPQIPVPEVTFTMPNLGRHFSFYALEFSVPVACPQQNQFFLLLWVKFLVFVPV